MTEKSKKARRLRKKLVNASHGIPDLAGTPRREKNGCFVERTRQQGDKEAEPRLTVLSARARHMGRPDTEENRLALTGHMFGDHVGQAIQIGGRNKDEADSLWQVFWLLDRSDATYHARILGTKRHAKCGKMEYLPERFEARPDDVTDYRTEDEKDRDAVNRWMYWHGLIGCLASHEQSSIWDGVYLRCDLHKEGKLTTAGLSFVASLRVLSSIYSGNR